MKRIFATLIIITALAVSTHATDLYVADSGNDAASGTQAAPFKTLDRAKAAVRALLASAGDPINVYLRQGTYYLDSTLLFTPQDGGTTARPVTYSAYQGEKVILSGGRKITPLWSAYSGNVKVADIGTGYDFDMLFLNDDQRLIMARYPNYDSTQILQGSTDITGRIGQWKNPKGGFLRAIHDKEWGGNSFTITGVTAGKLDLLWAGDNDNGSGIDPAKQMVENIFEELDAPGEWFYDKAAGKLYLYPPVGADLNGGFVVGATLKELIRVVGTPTRKAGAITFSGFTFTHTHRTLFTGIYEPLSRSDWTVVRTGAIYIQDAENVTVKDCLFPGIGGNGIFMSGYNRNHVVSNCDFSNVGASAVVIAGNPDAVRSYCTWKSCVSPPKDFTPGPAGDDYPKGILVTYCYMYNTGMFEKQTSAVCISMSEEVTVSHCTAHRGPRAGFNVCDGTFGGHVFEYNDVFDQVRETQDHGPFNSWGRDRWWGRSLSDADARKYALLDIWKPNTIRNNRISNPAGRVNLGVNLDDGSTNYRIYNNLLINMGFKSQHGFDHFASNNILINGQGTFHQWNLPDMRKYVTHNIIVNKNPYYCRTKDFFPNTGLIDSNVFWNNGAAVALVIDNGTSEITATPTWTQDMLDQHSVTADPQFVDAAKGDYRVKPGSPALALGFVNFPMDQFGKPGYPVCPGCLAAAPTAISRPIAASPGAAVASFTALSGSEAFRFLSGSASQATFTVYSLAGRMVAQSSMQGTLGARSVGWDAFGNLPDALYLIEMRTPKGSAGFIRALKTK